MRSTQKKFLAAIEAAIIDAGFEPIHNARYSNTGVVLAEPADAFEPVLRVGYGFFSGYAKLNVTDGVAFDHRIKEQSLYVVTSGKTPGGSAVNLQGALDRIKAVLTKAKVAA